MDNRVEVEEGCLWYQPDDLRLYTKTWKPKGKPRAIIAFYHGFSDHSNTWYQFFPNLASAGFEVRSLDQRGWGQSVSRRKQRGDFGATEEVMGDLHYFLRFLMRFTQDGSIPLFLMGHSMGGMNSLYYVLNPKSPYYRLSDIQETGQIKLAGVVSIAPLVAVHPTTQPLKIVEYLGRIAAKVVPKMTMVQAIDAQWVSRDPVVVEDIRKDGELCHKTGTLEGLAGMLDRAAWLDALWKNPNAIASSSSTSSKNDDDNNNNESLIPPIWVGHGTADRITWFDATKRMVESLNVKDKTFKPYEGGYHKLTNDTDGVAEEITKDVVQWIEERISKGAVEGSAGETTQ